MGLPIIDIIGKIVDKVIPDPAARMELQLELAKLADAEAKRQHDEMMGQINVNTAEAGHRSLFVAGWRPAVGWICATGVAYSFILQPIAAFIAAVAGFKGTLPAVATADLMVLLTGMLGFGGLRSYEKKNRVADDAIDPPVPVAPVKKKSGIWPF